MNFTKNEFWYRDGNLDIAYLLGIYLTDGYIHKEKNGNWRLCVTTKDKDIPQQVAKASCGLFGKTPKVHRRYKSYKNERRLYWRVYVSSKSLSRWLENATKCKTILPDFVSKQTPKWQREFLSGVLDGDGWATFSQNRYKTKSGKPPTWYCQIGIVGIRNNTYLCQVPKLLDKLGVKYRINYQKPRKKGHLPQQRILIRPKSFLDCGLYFHVKRKQDKVQSFHEYISLPCPTTIRFPDENQKR